MRFKEEGSPHRLSVSIEGPPAEVAAIIKAVREALKTFKSKAGDEWWREE